MNPMDWNGGNPSATGAAVLAPCAILKEPRPAVAGYRDELLCERQRRARAHASGIPERNGMLIYRMTDDVAFADAPAPVVARTRVFGKVPHQEGRWAVLVPTDGSRAATRALRFALQLARRHGPAELHLLHVRPTEDDHRIHGRFEDAPELVGARRLLNVLDQPHVLCVAQGDPAEAIVRYAEQWDFDDVIMGTRVVPGSVTMKVLHACPVPVTLIKADTRLPGANGHWVVPADGSPNAERALEYVLARPRHPSPERVSVLNVQPDLDEPAGNGEPRTAHLEERWNLAERVYADICARLHGAGVRHRFHVRFGDPALHIVESAAELECERIVMGAAGLTTLGDLALGSVAHRVAHCADVPVTLVK